MKEVSIQDRVYRRGYHKGYSDGVKEQKEKMEHLNNITLEYEKEVFRLQTMLKEQETEIRQLKLALDIAKGTCKGIVFETDEKFMGDL